MSTILIVDDNETLNASLEAFLGDEGCEVFTATTAEDGLDTIKNGLIDVVLLDLKLPGMNGLDALRRCKEIDKDISVIMMTAHGQIETAVEAMKSGAYDYVSKPFKFDEMKIVIDKTLERASLKNQIKRERLKFDNVIGESKQIRSVYQVLKKIIDSDATTILIQGETGTGKGLLAQTIHYHSKRKEKPFIELNCSSMPENLVESELFGHEKGAFTDAKRSKKGLIEEADGGTAFLDEIGDLHLSVQVKLLKVIEEKTFRRIGALKDIAVDIRIISATNRDLESLVDKGDFREDLFYRLNVVQIYVPPLRERKEDIPVLANHFLERYNAEFGKEIRSISSEAMQLLIDHPWWGNVRELKNTIERTCLLENSEVIRPEHLSLRTKRRARKSSQENNFACSLDLPIDRVEKLYIKRMLERTNGNKSKALKLLGISRNTLDKKLREMG